MTGGWPTLDRYRSVFCWLNALLTSTISSFSGTSAFGCGLVSAADSSSSACDVLGVPPVGQVGRRIRAAAEGRVQEVVEQRVVTAVDQLGGGGQRGRVGRVVLRGLAVAVQQVDRW